MANRVVEVIDVGDSVRCDLCNQEFRGSNAAGGILVQSKAICPTCTPKYLLDLKRYGETYLIRGSCPPGMTFHAWVMSLRNGVNTITVTEFDSVDELLGG